MPGIFSAAIVSVLLGGIIFTTGCDRGSAGSQSTSSSPTSRPAKVTVASLSPAATDLLIGMNLSDRLVAVSNYDRDRDGTRGLPRVGDYQTTDWERLALLRPGVMVTQFAADRLPLGLVQKAKQLNIELLNVPITRLDDIAAAMVTLGKAAGEPNAGAAAAQQFRARIAAVASHAANRPKVRTLIVLDDEVRGVAGRDNYLNDVLEAAGGENVIPPHTRSPYPTIDREMLVAFDPEVVFQLMPGASPQVRASAQRVWQKLPQLRAIRNGRVHIFTDSWALTPSQHVAELAERFGRALDEARGSAQPATSPISRAPVIPREAEATGGISEVAGVRDPSGRFRSLRDDILVPFPNFPGTRP